MPSMLKQDQAVNVTADALDYDGAGVAGDLQRERAALAGRNAIKAASLDDRQTQGAI